MHTPHDEEMMGLALAEASAALQAGVFPVGAVLATPDRVLGRSHKHMGSNHLAHAEMNLFHSVFNGDYPFQRGDGITLYTTLEPCVMCFGTFLHLPLQRLVFAMEDAYGGCAGTRMHPAPPRHQHSAPQIVGGLHRNESRALFARFLQATDEPFWVNGGAPEFQAAVRGPV